MASGRGPIEVNIGFFPGRKFHPSEIPNKLRGTRVRWTLHPEKSEAGPCEECRAMAGQFLSIEEGAALQPIHPRCVCSLDMEPAPGVETSYSPKDYSLQARRPELWNRAVEVKRDGCGHGH